MASSLWLAKLSGIYIMDAADDIKNRLSIEDVISRYVELKRAGRNYRGLSPFNNEKTPSFMVSPEKQIWHDFSSGKGGNMFSFVMEMEGIDFKGALELLARQAGLDLSQYQRGNDQNAKRKQELFQILELTTKFYQAHLKKNQPALEYIFKQRGFSKQTALEFRIGYSPSNGTALSKFLLSKGFNPQNLKSAGVSTQYHGALADMFRGRIMIPLMDPFGKVIGFTARLLEKESGTAPKYINTPQTLLYDKSRHVFGLHLAKEAIRKTGYVVVVEGNMDVIASYQVNVRQVVATAGTAMTEQHLKIVGRLTNDVRLAYDQDRAGLEAAERTIPLASKADISLSIITIIDAKDPDELIQKAPRLWLKAIESPQYALDWLIERYQKQLDTTTAQGKRQFTDILLKVVRNLADSVEQDHYITKLSKLIGVSTDALRTKLNKGGNETKLQLRRKVEPVVPSVTERELTKAQNHFLAIMLMQPGLRMYMKAIDSQILPTSEAQKLLTLLKKDPKFVFDETIRMEADSREFYQILVLLYEELYQGLELLDLRYEAAQLQARLLQQYVKAKKTTLAKVMRLTGETPELLNQAKELDELLNTVKEKING